MTFYGFLPGFINGLLGTGGGILAVAMLKKQGLSPNSAHATAVGLMLPLSAISLLLYLFRTDFSLWSYWPLLFPAIGGSMAGAFLLKRLSPQKLRFFFALLLLYTAFHLFRS